MRIYVMQGTTLAGKTEHGKRLALELGCVYVSSGNIARSLMDADTKRLFADGQLSPHDDLIRKRIYAAIDDASVKNRGVVLDGFPRTPKHVVDFIGEEFYAKVVVIKLNVPQEVIIQRSNLRSRDEFDTTEVALKRDRVYREETEPALDWLARFFGTQVIITLAAEAEPDSVFRSIIGELEDRDLL